MTEQTKQKIRKRIIMGLSLMIFWAGLALMDLVYIGSKSQWSGLEKFRIRMHLEYYTNVLFFIPPIGPLSQIHHTGRFVDAFIDHNMPPTYSMNFVRSLVIESEDCISQFQKHEKKVSKGQTTKKTNIECDVPFGYGAGDTFAIQVYSEKLDGKMNTAFFVNGLGLVPSTKDQSPKHIVRNMGPLKDTITPILINLDRMITNLVKQGVGKILYINLTDRPDTSKFSSPSNRMSINTWIEQTKNSNRQGHGYSVAEY